MKLNSLVLIAASIPTLAFAQNNYQTQLLTGTYFDQAYQYNITSGTAKYSAEEKLQQSQATRDRLEEINDHVANTQDRMSPNASPPNFNEPTPRMGR